MSSFQHGLLLVSVGLFLGAMTRFVQTKWLKVPIPYTVVLLLIGLLLGALENKLGMLSESVASVKSINPHLLLGAFIPALIFESAFSVNYHVQISSLTFVVSPIDLDRCCLLRSSPKSSPRPCCWRGPEYSSTPL